MIHPLAWANLPKLFLGNVCVNQHDSHFQCIPHLTLVLASLTGDIQVLWDYFLKFIKWDSFNEVYSKMQMEFKSSFLLTIASVFPRV